jgi:hypothetical protein
MQDGQLPQEAPLLSASSISDRLRQLGVSEPTRSRLAALPHLAEPDYLAAWVRWFEHQTGKGSGWVIRQIEVGDPPPSASGSHQLPAPPTLPEEIAARVARMACHATNSQSPGECLWRQALGELQLQMTRVAFDTWLKPTQLVHYHDGTLRVGVPSEQIRDWLTHRLHGTILRTAKSIAPDVKAVEFCVLSPTSSRGMPIEGR